MLLGALIGAERQWRQRMAGLRTTFRPPARRWVFILSAMSASPDSPGRIAAQIVSGGIGFLWGRGDYARWHERPRPQYRRATLWCSRSGRRTLPGTQFWNATAATLIISVRQYPGCASARRSVSAEFLAGAGDEEKRHVLRARHLYLSEHENAVRQLLLNTRSSSGLPCRIAVGGGDHRDHLEICAQLISHKQHQKRWRKLWRRWAFKAERHIGALACRRGVGAGGGAAEMAASSRDLRHPAERARMASSQEVIRMLNNGCVPSESGPTEVTADFLSFYPRDGRGAGGAGRVSTPDDDQPSLIARLDAPRSAVASTTGRPQGYVWGRTGRGKSFIFDHFFASLPLAARRRVHFHHFFRELHQRLNAPGAPDLQTVMRQMTSGCRLLCFDEFHLHDPGDAMLIKALLEHLFQHGIVLLATSNYPPEMLLPNPLYHDRFLPSIALIRAHLTVVALNGEEDYRVRHLSQDNAFCSGRMWVNPNAQQRQLYDLPSLPGEPVSLTVGYRTLLAAAASPALLHFTFTQLCQAATAVMDYLTLCESYAVWLLDEVPPLATVGPAAQQRFINVIDVLYEKQIRLLLVTRCDLETLVAGVELEDIQRTRSRLQQLPRAV